jgi:hypothetical protein
LAGHCQSLMRIRGRTTVPAGRERISESAPAGIEPRVNGSSDIAACRLEHN